MKVPYRITPLHHWHERHGGTMTTVSDWKRVLNYGNLEAEQEANRSAVGICDVTYITKINVQGKHSDELLTQTSNSRVPKVGHCVSIPTSDKNNFPTRLARLTDDRFLVLGEAESCAELHRSMEAAADNIGCAHVEDFTSSFAAFWLLGPKSHDVLKKLGSANIESVPLDGCLQASIARAGAVLIRWNDGEPSGWLLLVSRDYGEYVWECVLSAGHEFGIRPFGLEAQRVIARRGAR